MGIVDTLFRRFKELAAAAEKARETSKTPNQEEESNPTTKTTLADTVLQIQKMERKRPQP